MHDSWSDTIYAACRLSYMMQAILAVFWVGSIIPKFHMNVQL